MRVGDLIHFVLHGIAIHRAAPKERAGKAGAFVVLRRNRARDVNVHDLVGDVETPAECSNRRGVKRLIELRIDGECGDVEVPFQTLAQDCKRVGEKYAVLAA